MTNLHKNLKSFLFSGENGGRSLCHVHPEALALLLARELNCNTLPLAVTLPDAKMVEKIFAQLEIILDFAGIKKKILKVPESGRGKLLFPGGEARRARALNRILNEEFDLIIGSVHAMLGPAPPPGESRQSQMELRCGMTIPIPALLQTLVTLDYDDEVTVSIPGEFSHRGGIVDIFSPAHDEPCRIEFFGDEIDSMRFFSPESQRSTAKADSYRIINRAGITAGGAAASDLFEYLEERRNFRMLDIFPDSGSELLTRYSVPGAVERWQTLQKHHPAAAFYDSPAAPPDTGAEISDVQPLVWEHDGSTPGVREKELRFALLKQQLTDAPGEVIMLTSSPEDIPLLQKWCEAGGLPLKKLNFEVLPLENGFETASPAMTVFTVNELARCGFVRSSSELTAAVTEDETEKTAETEENSGIAAFSFGDFDEGDHVVHLDFGIAICRGIKKQSDNGEVRELICLEFRGGQLLHVPMTQAGKISRYLGAAGKIKLHALGGAKWDAEKQSARSGVRDYAAEMLRFQAVRQAVKGIAFNSPAADFRAFLRQFPFRDTRCQIRSTREIINDMIQPKPMDRLLCGDVGYGKTEIAMRAAFKAVNAGYQVAVIAPTTVLAQQHFLTFYERFKEYPFVIDTVSRFRSGKEQRSIARQLETGGIDIIIGTHRLCGSSFKFKNLGLVIIDEEQRFGVEHKERLRRFRVEADVLSMSATPIPRTLYLAMAGARDLSTLVTPPKLRLPVKTVIAPQEDELVITAIRSELARGGQVYYLHNRVNTIDHCAGKLQNLLPDARIAVAHGQMDEDRLAEIMDGFQQGKVDILVCSTIVESGLDVPNANTIIIERADRFGLAELYQLRGRVGRWKQQAYAYMLLPKDKIVGSAARKRLAAIRRCSVLGSGFQLALRDLEIRGAGNLLGAEQSGHLNLIGFDLYCRLLKQEIARMQGRQEMIVELPELGIDFIRFALKTTPVNLAACLPDTYIENDQLRIASYRQLGELHTREELDEFASRLEDIFGRMPDEVKVLLELARLRIMLWKTGFKKLTVANNVVSISNPGGVVYRRNGIIPRLDPRDPPRLRLKHLQAVVGQILQENEEKK